jgi:5-methylcytosine-specific restriction endonuclease McrA
MQDTYAGPNGEYFDPRLTALMLELYSKLYDLFDGDLELIDSRIQITSTRVCHRLCGGDALEGEVGRHGNFTPRKRLTTTSGRPAISRAVRDAVMERDGFRCRQCQSIRFIEIDHVHPVSKGGGNEISNLQLLCRSCNRQKRDRLDEPQGD